MNEKTKRTVSISFDQSQIDLLDNMASQHRRETGENMTRSEVVRDLVQTALSQRQASSASSLSPASLNTPIGGRSGERSDAAAGGIEHGQEG
jgi:metal-responsive CopG/Arc/MetJ family transcriptional regulator